MVRKVVVMVVCEGSGEDGGEVGDEGGNYDGGDGGCDMV